MKGVPSEYFARVRFDKYTQNRLIDHLLSVDGYCSVVTPNVDHVIRANRDEDILKLYLDADISINDSRILNLLSRKKNIDLGDVIPGSDLTKAIFERLAGSSVPITIIGASDETVTVVKDTYNLSRVSHYNPPMGFIKDETEVGKCLDFMKNSKGEIFFLAIGSPRQEIIAKKAKERGMEGVFLSIGASLLFLSGEERRAPQIFQKLSLEWLFRLCQSPRRLAKRYLVDGLAILPLFLKEPRRKG
ncbi:MAG: WecB/TagA/CpsF family glycosyltransferase [Spirochaetales bacterium]|nr:WecB/TagA/CpsF family glycosyltransferase [Spirochaetales bacterium]